MFFSGGLLSFFLGVVVRTSPMKEVTACCEQNVVECNGKRCDETNFSTKKHINQSKVTGI